MADLKKWDLLASETIVDNPWHGLRRDTVRLPDGTVLDDYFVSLRQHLAVVFAVTTEAEVLLVRQYKHGVREITTELPAGTFSTGDPAAHARRELREETGYDAASLEALGSFHFESVRGDSLSYAFLAREVRYAGEQQLDENEASSGLEVVTVPLTEIVAMIDAGVLKDQSSVLCAMLALRQLG